jgi:hypothetical protein
MRISNKISINGDTLLIFEQKTENGLKVGDVVKIDPIASEQSGLEPNKLYKILDFITYGKGLTATINVILDKNLYTKTSYSPNPKGAVAIDYVTKSMEESSFNPMKSKKLYYHVLEDGGYGRIGHQGYYNTEAEAQKRANELSDMFPKSDFYVEAYPSKREPVTVTMEGSFNPMKGNSNNKGIASSEFNGNIITWYDYEVEETNIDGGGYTDSISLMGKDEAGNEYTAIGTKTFDDIEDIEDIQPVSSINEAKKEKKAPAEKKKADKTNYGNKDMSDVDMVNPYELKKGIRIEMVDTEDYVKAMDKAVKKLKKDPMFYSNLISNAKETKGKRADVPTEVKDKKLNKVSDKMKDKANEMEVSKKDVTKKNANDSLNKSEKAKGKPKGVKEMTMTPKKSKGMKSMDVPGKEKKTNLKESFNLWESFKKNILR